MKLNFTVICNWTIVLLVLAILSGCQEETEQTPPAVVITFEISAITTTSAASGGSISDDGGSPILEKGIVWDLNPQPTIALATKTNEGAGPGTFTSTLSGLEPAKQYYVRAYATNNVGTSYGDELTFSTLANLPTLTAKAITNITYTTATSGGELTSDGGVPIIAKGVVWSTEPNPTISLSTKTVDSGTETFSSAITGLTKATRYYLRAYATSSAGTAYSQEVSFTTASGVRLHEIKSGAATYLFEYDAQFRLRKRTITPANVPSFFDSLVITYSSGKALINEYDTDAGLYLKQDHTLNGDGYSVSYTQTLFNPKNVVVEYGPGFLVTEMKINGSTPWYSFTHELNNMTRFQYHLGVADYTIEYYPDKLNSLALGFGIDEDFYNSQFTQNHHPLLGKPSQNLIKKITFAPGSTNPYQILEFTYEMDQDGDVRTTTLTRKKTDGSVVSTSTISYKKYYF